MPGPLRWSVVAPLGALVALAALATAAAQPEPGELRLAVPSGWPTGQPVAIAVADGQAEFDVPTPSGASALVIVSALAKGPGPFPIRLRAVPAQVPSPPPVAEDGPNRPPALIGPIADPTDPPSGIQPPSQRIFHLMVREGDVASASNYLPLRGMLRAVGQRVQVYVDSRDLGAVRDELLRDVVNTFDQQVFPVAAKQLGVARDIDGDGRFTVLLTGWLARLGGGRLAVDGFVRGADLDPDLGAPFGNRCDMMYLNARITPGPHLRTVLAHEYTHAITASQKAFGGPDGAHWGPEEEGWLDEALAHLAEDLHGFSRSNIDYRISAFLSCPERYRLVVDDYYASDLFRSHGNRGSTYLFLRWCADRFGPDLLTTLVRSPLRGLANLETACGMPFPSLYRQWSVALASNGLLEDQGRGYRSVNLRGGIEGWPLAGPRTTLVRPGGPDDVWSAAGTTSHFVRVAAAATGAVHIDLRAPAEADLQVTVIPLPDDLPQVELSAVANKSADGRVWARVRMAEHGGSSVHLDALAWEPLVPCGDAANVIVRHGQLVGSSLAAQFGTSVLTASGQLVSKPIPLDGVSMADGPLMLKATGTDGHGHKVSAWAEVLPIGCTVRPDEAARQAAAPLAERNRASTHP